MSSGSGFEMEKGPAQTVHKAPKHRRASVHIAGGQLHHRIAAAAPGPRASVAAVEHRARAPHYEDIPRQLTPEGNASRRRRSRKGPGRTLMRSENIGATHSGDTRFSSRRKSCFLSATPQAAPSQRTTGSLKLPVYSASLRLKKRQSWRVFNGHVRGWTVSTEHGPLFARAAFARRHLHRWMHMLIPPDMFR